MSMGPLDRLIPVFPLPNCVLLPGAAQCLHIFEPRYRQMVADELDRVDGRQLVALALLRPGYESMYCTHSAPIHPSVCIGELIKHQQLVDGRYNILLLGVHRATIVKEQADRPYRRGRLQIVQTIKDLEPSEEQHLLIRLNNALKSLPEDLRSITSDIAEQAPSLEQLVDLLSFHVLPSEAAAAKMMILAEPRLDFRARMLTTLLQRLFESKAGSIFQSSCPPHLCDN